MSALFFFFPSFPHPYIQPAVPVEALALPATPRRPQSTFNQRKGEHPLAGGEISSVVSHSALLEVKPVRNEGRYAAGEMGNVDKGSWQRYCLNPRVASAAQELGWLPRVCDSNRGDFVVLASFFPSFSVLHIKNKFWKWLSLGKRNAGFFAWRRCFRLCRLREIRKYCLWSHQVSNFPSQPFCAKNYLFN